MKHRISLTLMVCSYHYRYIHAWSYCLKHVEHRNTVYLELLTHLLFPRGLGKDAIFIRQFEVRCSYTCTYIIILIIFSIDMRCWSGSWSVSNSTSCTFHSYYWNLWWWEQPNFYLCWEECLPWIKNHNASCDWCHCFLFCIWHHLSKICELHPGVFSALCVPVDW